MEIKPAYSIDELAKAGPLRRSSIYNAITRGELIAQKVGRRTIITHKNWEAFLEGCPVVVPAKSNSAA